MILVSLMFKNLVNIFRSKHQEAKENNHNLQKICYLIYEIISADHIIDDMEIELTAKRLDDFFQYKKDESTTLLNKLKNDNFFNANLAGITQDLKKSLSYDQRIKIIQICWEVLLVDNNEDILETATARKIGILLGIEDHDYISIRNIIKNSQ